MREMAGAPGNPSARNDFLARTVEPSVCHCVDAFGGKEHRRVPTPLRSYMKHGGKIKALLKRSFFLTKPLILGIGASKVLPIGALPLSLIVG